MSRALAIADLYWATRDMARAALDASTDIPGWSVEALPSGFGILALEAGSLPPLPMGGSGQAFGLGEPRRLAGLRAPADLMPRDIDVRAISWARSGQGVRVAVWGTADAQALTIVRGDAPTILPAMDFIEVGEDHLDDLSLIPGSEPGRAALALLGAAVTMMQTPTVAEARAKAVTLTKRVAGGMPRRQLVTTISLRRLEHKPPEPGEQDRSREYTHRWVVRGHWRQQAHGPKRGQRKVIWVPSHVKGPEGAPLLAREHVHVWRR